MRVPFVSLVLTLLLCSTAASAAPAGPASPAIARIYQAGRGYCITRNHQRCTLFTMSAADARRTFPNGRRYVAPNALPEFPYTSPFTGLAVITPYSAAFPQGITGPADLQQDYGETGRRVPVRPLPLAHRPLVMILAYDDDPFAEADLGVFRQQFNLPPCTIASGCLTIYNQYGGVVNPHNPHTYPGPDTLTDGDVQRETMLDLESVSALCPLCKLALVEVDYNTEHADSSSFLTQGLGVAKTIKPIAISMSYNFDENQTYTNEPYVAAIGRAMFASSGDTGYATSAGYPASSPHVTAVGETIQFAVGPFALPGSGSGCSQHFATPLWQLALNICGMRAWSDIAAQGQYFPEYDSYCPLKFWRDLHMCGWMYGSGTSESAPLMAGLYGYASSLLLEALQAGVRHPSLPIAVPAELYTQPAGLFFDVYDAYDHYPYNGGPCPSAPLLCSIGPGWDGATGLGVPLGPAAFLKP